MQEFTQTFTLLDWLIVMAVLGSVYSACKRGLGKETLHTLLYLLSLGFGVFFFGDQLAPANKEEAAHTLVSLGYYAITVYVVMWAVLKFGAPLILDGGPVGFRGAFWAGSLALVKTVGTILGLNLWLAVHSPDAHPLRLNILPDTVRSSALVQVSDSATDDIYRWLASKGWLDYAKYTERPETEAEQKVRKFDEIFGLVPPPPKRTIE